MKDERSRPEASRHARLSASPVKSKHRATVDHSALRHDDNSIPNIIIVSVMVLWLALGRDVDIVPDARIFIDDGPLDAGVLADTEGGGTPRAIAAWVSSGVS